MKGVQRPKAVVLSPKALVPPAARITPAPNQFTHVLVRRQPYFYAGGGRRDEPDGYLTKGTKVVLLVRRAGACYVADRRGLYVRVACEALRRLG